MKSLTLFLTISVSLHWVHCQTTNITKGDNDYTLVVSSDLFLEKLSEAKAANHHEIEVPTTGVITDHVVPLVDHPACKGDLIELHKSCHATRQEMRENDVIALICAQNADPDHSGLSNTCQNVLWKFKLGLTQSDNFLKRIKKNCRHDLDAFQECDKLLHESPGLYMSCIVTAKQENPDSIGARCHQFLGRIETIIFSDYRLVGDFANKCQTEIEGHMCGRISQKVRSDAGQQLMFHHSQGTVIECLANHFKNLTRPCQMETAKIMELQSEDYHLDRALFFACKNDREDFCASVQSGDGKVYDCLMNNMNAKGMSSDCRAELSRRLKIEARDYRVNYAFTRACRSEIVENGCERQHIQGGNEGELTARSRVLLCLEDVIRNEEFKISQKCKIELDKEREEVMSDADASPELLVHCSQDLEGQCSPGQHRASDQDQSLEPGQAIHCLMRAAQKGQLQSGVKCQEAILTLLQEVSLASNWKLDPVLQRACQDVVNEACDPKAINPSNSFGQGEVMSCLLSQKVRSSRVMTDQCNQRLNEIQYFLSRDFTLTPKLYKACRSDAESLCSANRDWHVAVRGGNAVKDGRKFVFPCLVRHLYEDQDEDDYYEDEAQVEGVLSRDCQDQVRVSLRQRAMTLNLHPQLEERCRQDLIALCQSPDNQGKELRCLQRNLPRLDPQCKRSVVRQTRVEAKDATLNAPLIAACKEVIEDHCDEEATTKGDEGSLMRCLIAFRMSRDENEVVNPNYQKCDAAIESWQKTAGADVKFSPKFWKTCKKDIKKNNCLRGSNTRDIVVQCLADVIMKDANDSENPGLAKARRQIHVSLPCQNEVKFQLMQSHSDIKLNPRVLESCQAELKEHCGDVEGGYGKQLECLKNVPHKDMSKDCQGVVFHQEREEAVFNKVDTYLMTTCKKEIKHFCREAERTPNSILSCLKMSKDDSMFGMKCRQVVRKRVIQQSADYRLNPALQVACAKDMAAHCSHVIQGDQFRRDQFMDGKLLTCLVKSVLSDRNSMAPQCRAEIKQMLRTAAVDYEADPILLKACPKSIETCKSRVDLTAGKAKEDGGLIEECLKSLMKEDGISEKECKSTVARRIELGSVDLSLDPLLKSACAMDLTKFCLDVPATEAQQTECLVEVSRERNEKRKLKPRCQKLVEDRIKELQVAVKQLPVPEGLQDLFDQLRVSPHRNYFVIVFFTMVTFIFLFGLVCGRASRKARREMKIR